ncbi:MAG: EamA family transporter RarD [Corallincola sp.]|nr:EamA family transporter RarD [Corallincola sp.]
MMDSATRKGLLAAAGAYTIWGLMPVYFKQLTAIGADAVLVHRVVWSVLLLALILLLRQRLAILKAVIANRRQLLTLTATALLIAVNWLIYVWAIHHERLLEASLGYYINPLLNIGLGFLLLGERLNRRQWLAIALAAIGVAIPLIGLGQIPWVSLALAGTFAAYGLLRKQVAVDSISGLLLETLLLLPFALLYGWWAGIFPGGQWQAVDGTTQLLLIGVGVITAVPLVFFGTAAQHLRLSTLGFFQYIGPSTTFLLATLVYGEPLTSSRLLTFAFIWGGLALITLDLWRQHRAARQAVAPAAG